MLWKNKSLQSCSAIYNILSKIENVGLTLPDNKSADDLLSLSSKKLLDYGQQVYDDTVLWNSHGTIIGLENSNSLRMELLYVLTKSR